MKEEFDIYQFFKAPKHSKEAKENLEADAEDVLGEVGSITLNETSKNISKRNWVYMLETTDIL